VIQQQNQGYNGGVCLNTIKTTTMVRDVMPRLATQKKLSTKFLKKKRQTMKNPRFFSYGFLCGD